MSGQIGASDDWIIKAHLPGLPSSDTDIDIWY